MARRFNSLLVVLPVLWQPSHALACAACYGASDSPMAQGMNWGILTLLGITVPVLATIAGFFVFLAKKAASARALTADRSIGSQPATLRNKAQLAGLEVGATQIPHRITAC